MKKLTEVILDCYKKAYSTSNVDSMDGYLMWLNNIGLDLQTPDEFEYRIPFTIDSCTPDTVYQDVIELVKKYSSDGYIVYKNKKYDFNIMLSDQSEIDFEIDWMKNVTDFKGMCKWLDVDNKEFGLYRICSINKNKRLSLDLVIRPDFKGLFWEKLDKCLISQCLSEKIESVIFKGGKLESYDFELGEEYITENLQKYVLEDLSMLVDNFTVLVCAPTQYALEWELGVTVYIIIFGYSASSKQGEGWIISDYVRM